jgi:hypothetical protein
MHRDALNYTQARSGEEKQKRVEIGRKFVGEADIPGAPVGEGLTVAPDLESPGNFAAPGTAPKIAHASAGSSAAGRLA